MEQGTADVRAALGVEASKVTTEQIQEALWHYYYDVDKSVTYLLTKFIAPPPPKAAKSAQKPHSGKHTFSFFAMATSRPVSRSGPGASAYSTTKSEHSGICGQWPSSGCRRHWAIRSLRGRGVEGNGSSLTRSQGDEPQPSTCEISPWKPERSFLSALFKDMPWGNIPQERVTVFVEPQRPRGGLLGGSGAAPKLTKLQQLALARKKKVEQQSSEEQAEDTREKLGELSMKEAPSLKENRLSEGGGFSKRQKLSDTTAAGRLLQREPAATDAEKRPTAIQRRSHLRDSSGQALSSLDGAEERAPEAGSPSTPFQPLPRSAADEPSHGAEMAGPSDFAQTLFGSPAVEPEPPANKLFALPYMAYCPSLADAFSKPSPDDVVLAAQAKGSITGKAKN